jgi:hypothetical protein
LTLATSLCHWLGTEQDREARYAREAEEHLCYAVKRRPRPRLDHQRAYCLGTGHTCCLYYREPNDLTSPRILPEPLEVHAPAANSRSPFPWALALLWITAFLVGAVVVVYYGSALLGLASTAPAMAHGAASPSPASSPAPTTTPSPAQVVAAKPFVLIQPTATPTPYPGGAVWSLLSKAGAAGWVASDESQGNHLGDSYLYAGVFDGTIYHGMLQIDLSPLPRGATIYAAVLEITGLDGHRLNRSGVWQVRILDREADAGWSRHTFQDLHNAGVQWTLLPPLGAGDLAVGGTQVFELSRQQARDLEQRRLEEHDTVSFRIDGPLVGENNVFAWDTGTGPKTQGRPPRLLPNMGPAPQTPLPTGSPPPSSTPSPTSTPVWVAISSTPTAENVVTVAAIAVRETAWATTTGTATALPDFVATPTPRYVVVTNTPVPANRATAVYLQSRATAHVILTGTPTPSPRNLATATSTPLPTSTPVVLWFDQMAPSPTPTTTSVTTNMAIPPVLQGKIAFLSDRSGKTAVYVLDPATGRVGLLTARWPYDGAAASESLSPDGATRAYVRTDPNNVPQIYLYSRQYGDSRQLTVNSGTNYDPAWSPRGDRLAFVSTESGNDDLYVIDASGQNQRRLTTNQWEWDKHPSWSPDGTRIVFWSNQGSGRKQLWIVNEDGTNRRLLLESAYNDWDPVWIKVR